MLHSLVGSTTLSLLWLKRTLNFMSSFLRYLMEGEGVAPAANTAFEVNLKPYLGYLRLLAIYAVILYLYQSPTLFFGWTSRS